MDLRSTSNHEKPSDPPAVSPWGRPSGLRPGFRPARSFPVTSGRFFNGAAVLPLGAERHVTAGSAGDLVAGDSANCVLRSNPARSPKKKQRVLDLVAAHGRK
jgi:hypothetical protein